MLYFYIFLYSKFGISPDNMNDDALSYLNINFKEGQQITLISKGYEREGYEITSDGERVGIIVLFLEEDPVMGFV